METILSYVTESPCYKQAKKLVPEGIVLHSTGTAQPKAQAYISLWNNANYTTACCHGVIDGNTGDFYQALPFTYKGWHAEHYCNERFIGIEMAEPAELKYMSGAQFTFKTSDKGKIRAVIERTYDSAVELFAGICSSFKLDPLSQIYSHSECQKKGWCTTGHVDPEHLWTSPLLKMGLTMDGFRKDVADTIGRVWPSGAESSTRPFLFRVTTSRLRIRKGPGTNYMFTGNYTGVGTFTIVDVKQGIGSTKGWGLLKAYSKGKNGWISLDYGEEVT